MNHELTLFFYSDQLLRGLINSMINSGDETLMNRGYKASGKYHFVADKTSVYVSLLMLLMISVQHKLQRKQTHQREQKSTNLMAKQPLNRGDD